MLSAVLTIFRAACSLSTRSRSPSRAPFCTAGEAPPHQPDDPDQHRLLSTHRDRVGPQLRPGGAGVRETRKVCVMDEVLITQRHTDSRTQSHLDQ